MPTQYRIAFWNVENLFDIEGSPRREEKVARAIGGDIKGWTQALLDRKIAQLAAIIRQMGMGAGPDLLGVCEVENRFVLEMLVQALAPLGRNYQIVHHDTEDRRGIDVAFIYDGNKLSVPSGPGIESVFSHFVLRRNATRDIVQVNFMTAKNRMLVLMGNHWPSRTGGESESDAYRAMAGETLSYFHERVLDIYGNTTPVLAMGDFNDEPFDPSLTDYALALRSKDKVVRGRNPYFLNLMWPLMGSGLGSYYFDGHIMLDNILVNRNLLNPASPFQVLPNSANILRFPLMTERSTSGPRRFGGMGKEVDQDGYSDHFPVEVALVEAD
jgi:predicted extracellular nuclease